MKKTKLITSIFALCCSLLALSFGVYAAVKQVDYTVNGTLSYEVTDLYVTINTKVYKSNSATLLDQAALNTEAKTLEGTTLSEISGVTYYGDDTNYSHTYSNYPSVQGELQTPAFDLQYSTDSTSPVFANYIVIEVINHGGPTAYVSITDNTSSSVQLNSYKYISGLTTVASGETKTVVIGYALEDPTLSIDSSEFNFNVSVASLLKENTTDGYWYLEMGSYNGTPIEWRLISTDGGQTAHTYTAGETITGDCVFIQNTYTKNMAFNSSSSYKQATEDDEAKYPGITSGDYYLLDDNGNYIVLSEGEDSKEYVFANNYEYSEIREYITGDMITDLGLTDDETYAKIQANTDVHNDKFYLLSVAEAYSLFSSSANRTFYNGSSMLSYWLRSSSSFDTNDYANLVDAGGSANNNCVTRSYAVRAAFKITL